LKQQQPKIFNEVVLSHASTQGLSYNKALLDHIIYDLCGLDASGIFLDVGGGWGQFTTLARQMGFDAFCIDREKPSDLDGYYSCDITVDTLPFENDTVDVVFCKSTIEHLYVTQLPHFVAEVQRILKPGGFAIFITPDWAANHLQFYSIFSHVTPYTKSSMLHFLLIYGFKHASARTLIQLPATWKNPIALYFAILLRLLPIPRSLHKWIRWSKELSIIGIGQKK